MLVSPHDIGSLTDLAVACVDDPLGFVYAAYPWGEEGTPLADYEGPDTWQIDELERLGEHCRTSDEPYRMAIASGHGIGKSAFTSWLISWFAATRPHPQIVCTANTQQQLRTKTWRELAKWHGMSVFREWFTWTATMYYHTEHASTWFAAAIPWSEHKAEAFQGTHEAHVLLVFDEASLIPPIIWETAEGALTQPNSYHFAFGNPTRNTGTFRTLFPGGVLAHRWHTRHIDSRDSILTNKQEIAQWAETYGGEDSDFFRVRVRGAFPRRSSTQLIGEDVVENACARPLVPVITSPIVLGVDVARFGDDASVILARRGPVIVAKETFRELDTMQLSSRVARMIDELRPVSTFVDVVGVGAGVVDRLRQLGYSIIGVNGGEVADDPRTYYNKRAEMWCGMRDWLTEYGVLDEQERTLRAELTGVEYGYDSKERTQLERKEDMKKRGLSSPDEADALALTFAQPVALPVPDADRRGRARGRDWNPLSRW